MSSAVRLFDISWMALFAALTMLFLRTGRRLATLGGRRTTELLHCFSRTCHCTITQFSERICLCANGCRNAVAHLLLALEEFRSLGIQFLSYQENIDTSSPLGQALFTIVSAVAQLERHLIRERVSAGNPPRQGLRKAARASAPDCESR
jgi:hypothetical protein